MTTIAIVTCIGLLVFLCTAGLLILADKFRMVLRQSALDYLEVWGKYHEKRIRIQQQESSDV